MITIIPEVLSEQKDNLERVDVFLLQLFFSISAACRHLSLNVSVLSLQWVNQIKIPMLL